MYIKEIGVVKFSEVCKRIFDFQIHDQKLSMPVPALDKPFVVDKFLNEKLYPQFMDFNIGEWSLEKFMTEIAKDNKAGVNSFWLKSKMRVVN